MNLTLLSKHISMMNFNINVLSVLFDFLLDFRLEYKCIIHTEKQLDFLTEINI